MIDNYTIDVLPGSPAETTDIQSSYLGGSELIRWGFADPPTSAGFPVTPRNSIRHSPIWQGANVIAGDIGQLLFQVFEREGETNTHLPNHPVDWLLTQDPNEFQTASVWLETMAAWSVLWGNGISAIFTDAGGRPEQLVPLLPDRVRPIWVSGNDYVIGYRLREGDEIILLPEQTVHVRGLTYDGFWGMSAVEICREAVANGMALVDYGNSTFRNGVRPSGVLEGPGRISPEARANLREEWEHLHAGTHNAARIAVLFDGIQWKQLSMSNQDAQWLQARELDLLFVAGLLNLPPYKLGYLKDSAVRANLEAQQREYFNSYLSRHANKIRDEVARKLFTFPERRRRGLNVKVDPGALTQGTRKEKMETLSLGVRSTIITRNEARGELGFNPVPGGDEFTNPATSSETDNQATTADSPTSSEQIQNALQQRGVGPLIAMEDCRIARGSRSRNFVAWLEKFVAQYLAMARPLIEPLSLLAGIDQEHLVACLEQHRDELFDSLLDVAESHGPDTFREAITQHLEDRQQRAVQNLTLNLMRPSDG